MDTVESMIALPFHPSHALSIREFKENMETVLREVEAEGNKIKGDHGEPFRIMQHIHDGAFYPDQALVSGCAGGLFENIVAIADILRAPLNDTENNAGTDTIKTTDKQKPPFTGGFFYTPGYALYGKFTLESHA